ncbi:IPT/TIG domain-containing protein [Streptomyces anulatus]|uniref:IPT/TIG domain-containing protein n=1 Tax=Streptomyces TaxID=1883 RepID=UPI001B3797D2|nr:MULTISPECIES: IPT/TIG domain-containing protein [Streptomyces]MBQ1114866.1 IPT/TIG domain-containing protein [Streptomyces sp. C3-3]WIY80577.1 IPT/TIG domain-containing protein [Streptomyces anulatus]
MPPTINTINPSQGPTTGGTTVTLTGAGMAGSTAVRFASSNATSFTLVSDTQITAVSPARAAGAAAVVVVHPTGNSNSVTFTYVVAQVPVITGVAPSNGPTSGGTSVTLTGTGFTGATTVTFAGVPATSFMVNSATQITAVTPAGSAGAAVVTVTTPGGTSAPNAFFFYAAPPVLNAAAPAQGPTAGGVVVTLTGTNLLNAGTVRFGGTNAISFTVVSATQITATAPPGVGSSPITVITPGGTSNPVAFTYVTTPTLTALGPSSGPTSAGTVVTLTGTNLASASAVTFGGTAASFTVVSDTQITAVAPAGPAGPATVTVTTVGGTSPGLTYTRVAGPGI